jgi:P4 family phage/plasmid primase-like protien
VKRRGAAPSPEPLPPLPVLKPDEDQDKGIMTDSPPKSKVLPPRPDAEALADGEACLAAALESLALGWPASWCCSPDHVGDGKDHSKSCGSAGKAPIHKWAHLKREMPTERDVRSWHYRQPRGNNGLFLGGEPDSPRERARLVRIDGDGAASVAELERLASQGPQTPTFDTGRDDGGAGVLYAMPPGADWRTSKEGDALGEFRIQATGAQTVLPPSRHYSGRRYRWRPGLSPKDVEVAPAPEWLVERMADAARRKGRPRAGAKRPGASGRDGRVPLDIILRKYIDATLRGGKRNGNGFDLACQIRDNRYTQEEAESVGEEFVEAVQRAGDHAYTLDEYFASVRSAFDREPREPWEPAPHLTDTGNGVRLVRRHGEDLRHCFPWRKWLAWDGCRWRLDDAGTVGGLAKETVRALYAEAQDEVKEVGEKMKDADEEGQARLARVLKDATAKLAWALKSEHAQRHAAMIDMARSECGVPVLPAELDRDPWLLNVPNGTVDLRTGRLREHRRDDLITRLCPTPFDPDAPAPTWERCLDDVFRGDWGMIAFVQRLLGYALTGDVREQRFPIWCGPGANGKTTVLDAVLGVLGTDYAMTAPAELLMAQHGERHPTELAGLFGMRLVVCAETDEGRMLNEARLKTLTGGDRIRARRMREDFWEFSPTHKVVLLTNHRPRVKGTDHALWRRIMLVPFDVTFADPAEAAARGLTDLVPKDKTMSSRLRAEAPGILRWLVDGCLQWQRFGGLEPPDSVTAATEAYRGDEDHLGRWLDECCDVRPDARIRPLEAYKSFASWQEANGERAWSGKLFGERMTARFTKSKSDGALWYHGVTVKPLQGGAQDRAG